MADVYTRIGYIKGDTGATGAQGAKGDTGDAATIQVGSVTTVPYGQTANVVNSGTEQAAVFDFTIPQGRPGQQTTEMDNLLLNSITTSSASFPIPAVGETGKVLWGKVTKWFSDMTALVATKLNVANVVNNLTTTASGYALDARQGKALNDSLTVKQETITFLNNVNLTLREDIFGTLYILNHPYIVSPVQKTWTDVGSLPSGFKVPYGIVTVPLVNGQLIAFRYIQGKLQYLFYPLTSEAVFLQGQAYVAHAQN